MARMVSDLLDYTRTRLGVGMPVTPAAMDLNALCRAVFDEFRAGHAGRSMHYRSAGAVAGEWDAARLRQAVSNLLANALQHSGGDARVELSLRADGDDALVAVCNDGPPIPAAALPTLFDPLAHGASPRRASRGGRGASAWGCTSPARSSPPTAGR